MGKDRCLGSLLDLFPLFAHCSHANNTGGCLFGRPYQMHQTILINNGIIIEQEHILNGMLSVERVTYSHVTATGKAEVVTVAYEYHSGVGKGRIKNILGDSISPVMCGCLGIFGEIESERACVGPRLHLLDGVVTGAIVHQDNQIIGITGLVHRLYAFQGILPAIPIKDDNGYAG